MGGNGYGACCDGDSSGNGGNRGVEGNVVGNVAVAAAELVMWIAATTTAAATTEARVMVAAMAARAIAFGEMGFLSHQSDNQPAC